MSEILGHDCDGRPLRAGDRVAVADADPRFLMFFPIGTQCQIIGVDPESNPSDPSVQLDLKPPTGYGECYSECDLLRRIDDRPETGSWEEVEKITGWNPTKQSVEA